MNFKRTQLGVLLGVILTLSGCASLQTPARFYQLDNGDAPVPTQAGGKAVLVAPVNLADYLRRPVLMRREADGTLSASNAQWAGDLQSEVDQLLVGQLASSLNSSRVLLDDRNHAPAKSFQPEVKVLIDIVRLDSGPEQPAQLDARWRLVDGNGKLQASHSVHLSRPHSGSEADQVKVQSQLLQSFAQSLAHAVADLKVPQQLSKDERRGVASKVEAESGVQQVLPIRTGVEVYQF